MTAGFTPGYHWLLIFQKSGEEVSPFENSARSTAAIILTPQHMRHLNLFVFVEAIFEPPLTANRQKGRPRSDVVYLQL